MTVMPRLGDSIRTIPQACALFTLATATIIQQIVEASC